MILFTWLYLINNFVYYYLNIFSLSYFGIFFLSIIAFLFSSYLLFWNVYILWKYNYTVEYILFNWVDFNNNLIILWNFKENLINSIFAFIMLFGAYIVTHFVFLDMNNDKEGYSFIILLGFFIIFMLIVIFSNNLLLFYLGWEGISLTSYFLVNFWSERVRSIKAVFKIFLISKIGDYFLIIFICLILINFKTVNIDEIHSTYIIFLNKELNFFFFKINFIDLLAILLVLGTSVKSAQYGFHIWLLEAMEAPLGASALMHSSTLVVAGVVLLFKLSFIVELSNYALVLMFILGSLSAFFGSFLACFQYELKTILAYSTVSNMGYIFVLFSLSLYYETILTIILHAFIKIYMFLTIGGLIFFSNGNQDIRWMGNLLNYVPFLWSSFLIGGFSLIGIPYFSGYYYKLYLINNLVQNYYFFCGFEFILILSYYFTIFYIFRVGYIVFFSSKNGHKILYKYKNLSIYFFLNLLVLGFIISFSFNFWQNILTLNYFSFINNYFNNNIYVYNPNINDLLFIPANIWYYIYIFISLTLFIYLFVTVNLEWSFLKFWSFITTIMYIIFIYFVF